MADGGRGFASEEYYSVFVLACVFKNKAMYQLIFEVSSVFSPIASRITWSVSKQFIVYGLGMVCWFPFNRYYEYPQAVRRLYQCVLFFGGNNQLQGVFSASESYNRDSSVDNVLACLGEILRTARRLKPGNWDLCLPCNENRELKIKTFEYLKADLRGRLLVGIAGLNPAGADRVVSRSSWKSALACSKCRGLMMTFTWGRH
jgi:hypothetical protein